MKKLSPLCALMILASCASRVEYQPFNDEEGGYRHKKISPELQMVNFVGNKETKKDTTFKFAAFRSIEICRDAGKKYSHILYVSGDINEEDVMRTYTPGYYGVSPFYGGYGYPGTAFAGGFGGYGTYYGGYRMGAVTRTYEDTITYPEATVVFECTDEAYEAKLELEEVPKEHLKRDNQGALKISSVPDDSPNKTILRKGDIILKAGGKRVETAYDLKKMFDPEKKLVEAQILRSGKSMNVWLRSADATREVAQNQQDIIEKTCEIEDFEHSFCSND